MYFLIPVVYILVIFYGITITGAMCVNRGTYNFYLI